MSRCGSGHTGKSGKYSKRAARSYACSLRFGFRLLPFGLSLRFLNFSPRASPSALLPSSDRQPDRRAFEPKLFPSVHECAHTKLRLRGHVRSTNDGGATSLDTMRMRTSRRLLLVGACADVTRSKNLLSSGVGSAQPTQRHDRRLQNLPRPIAGQRRQSMIGAVRNWLSAACRRARRRSRPRLHRVPFVDAMMIPEPVSSASPAIAPSVAGLRA